MEHDLPGLIEQISQLRMYANRVGEPFPDVASQDCDDISQLSPSVLQQLTRTWALSATNFHTRLIRDARKDVSLEVETYLAKSAMSSLGKLCRQIRAIAKIHRANTRDI